MPTVFTHAFVAVAGGKAFGPAPGGWKFYALAIACSASPDLDVGLFAYGVRYEDMFGHRGFFHSLTFAALLGLLVVLVAYRRELKPLTRRWWAYVLFFSGVTVSHGLLDAFTNGGHGIALFSPFDTTRYFFKGLIEVSDIGIGSLFRPRMAEVLWSEFRWVWLPVTVVCLVIYLVRVGSRKSREAMSLKSP